MSAECQFGPLLRAQARARGLHLTNFHGLFAPANHTVIASFLLSSLAVAGAILMILDMGDPMHPGWVQVSSEPMRRAMIEIGRP